MVLTPFAELFRKMKMDLTFSSNEMRQISHSVVMRNIIRQGMVFYDYTQCLSHIGYVIT